MASANNISEDTIRSVLDALALARQQLTIRSLRAFLNRKKLYTHDIYMHEMRFYNNRRHSDRILQLYEWRKERMKDVPFTREELILIVSIRDSKHKGDPHMAMVEFNRWLILGLRRTLGVAGFNALLTMWGTYPPSPAIDIRLVQIHDEMVSSTEKPRVLPDSKTYELILVQLYDQDLEARFYELVQRERKITPLLNERYMKKLFDTGRGAQAMEMYEESVRLTLASKPMYCHRPATATVLQNALHYCTLQGDLATTQKVFADAERLNIKPTSTMFASLIRMCARVGNAELAQSFLINDLPRHGIEMDSHIYNALIDLYCATDDLERSLSIYEEMCLRLPRSAIDSTHLIVLLLKRSDSPTSDMEMQARRIWDDLKRINHRQSSEFFANVCVHTKDASFAHALFYRASIHLPLETQLSAFLDDIVTHNSVTLIRALDALKILSKAPKFVLMPPVFSKFVKLTASAKEWIHCFDLAIELADLSLWLQFQVPLHPKQLKYVDRRVLIQSRAIKFFLYDNIALDFVEAVLKPNNIDASSFVPEEISFSPWTQTKTIQWKRQLLAWRSEATRIGLM